MATLKKGWIGPLRQAKDGKHPWVCDYAHPLSGRKTQRKIAEAGVNKKDRERLYHDFRHSLTDGRLITRENATFGDPSPSSARLGLGAAERHHLPDGANLHLQEKRKLSGDAL